jgi:lipopolysaccharide biosynthesis regulator YciM
LILLFLLLPVAFASGWWLASRRFIRSRKNSGRKLHPDYFKGLNFVLNEEPDKAIEIFIKLLEVDSETVETHLALGNLFRRRGEVDRAIRIHQNLIARPALSREFRSQALLELGLDYLRLGILDRAEGLFTELIAMDTLTIQAFTHLLDIYQQEKDWEKAISTARRLETITGERHEKLIAHFYCELAELDLVAGDEKSAKNNLKRALNLDPRCVRASLIEGRMLMNSGNYRAAISSFKRIEKQDDDYLDEAIIPLQQCYTNIGREDKFKEYLYELTERNNNIKPLVLLTDIIANTEDDNAAIDFVSDRLNKKPTVHGVDHFLDYVIKKSDGELKKYLTSIKELTTKLLQKSAIYQCNICGFEAKNIHWHCPGCKHWNTVKPLHGI